MACRTPSIGNATDRVTYERAQVHTSPTHVLVRGTEHHAFGKALIGNIGSFGVGLHAALEVCYPLGENFALVGAVRGMVELYDDGYGWAVGPSLGLRF